jgi:hypothetical protein
MRSQFPLVKIYSLLKMEQNDDSYYETSYFCLLIALHAQV